tara:strand:- start:887 stop:1576 length:690 start_codon:yes stop_codon:yes gene_type:complete
MVALDSSFQDFIVNQPIQVDLVSLVLSLILSALCALILGKLYIKYGRSLSNRRKFASNFILLVTTTTLIITVVKSSLALSLGLVGALSIVRFRAAIKEPEELAFLFLAIGIGLGFGASQYLVTIISFMLISLFIFGRHFNYKVEEHQNLYLTITGKVSKDVNLKKIVEVLNKNANSVVLKRFDQNSEDFLEASFLIDLDSFNKLDQIKNDLNSLSKSIAISYLDKSGLS